MTKTRLPNALGTFQREYFALVSYAHDKLFAEGETAVQVAFKMKPELTRTVAQLNSLRKSLEYWAPNSEVTAQINQIKFDKAEGFVPSTPYDEEKQGDVTYILVITRKHTELDADELKAQLPKFALAVKNVKIPTPEFDETAAMARADGLSLQEAGEAAVMSEELMDLPGGEDYMNAILNPKK